MPSQFYNCKTVYKTQLKPTNIVILQFLLQIVSVFKMWHNNSWNNIYRSRCQVSSSLAQAVGTANNSTYKQLRVSVANQFNNQRNSLFPSGSPLFTVDLREFTTIHNFPTRFGINIQPSDLLQLSQGLKMETPTEGGMEWRQLTNRKKSLLIVSHPSLNGSKLANVVADEKVATVKLAPEEVKWIDEEIAVVSFLVNLHANEDINTVVIIMKNVMQKTLHDHLAPGEDVRTLLNSEKLKYAWAENWKRVALSLCLSGDIYATACAKMKTIKKTLQPLPPRENFMVLDKIINQLPSPPVPSGETGGKLPPLPVSPVSFAAANEEPNIADLDQFLNDLCA